MKDDQKRDCTCPSGAGGEDSPRERVLRRMPWLAPPGSRPTPGSTATPVLSLRPAPTLGTIVIAMNGVTYIPSADELRQGGDTRHSDGEEGTPLSPAELLRVQPNIGWFLKRLARPRRVRSGRSTILASGWEPAPGGTLDGGRR